MKAILPALLFASLCSSVFAQESSSEPSARFGPEARAAYLRWEKATFEANVAYVTELKAALTGITRQGKLDEAVAIQAEIERISRLSGKNEKAPLAEFLVGTSWVSPLNGAVVTLKADGKGVRILQGNESEISWRADSETAFTIQWSVGATGRFAIAEDRKSIQGGGVAWTLKR